MDLKQQEKEIKEKILSIIKSNAGYLYEGLHDQEVKDLVNQLYILAKSFKWTKDFELEKRITNNINRLIISIIKTYGKDNQIELSESSFASQIGNETIEIVDSYATGKKYIRVTKKLKEHETY